MNQRIKIVFKYLASLSGILMMLGVIFLFISGFWDWHSLIENIGLALTAAGITTFLFRFDLSQMLTENGIRDSGIEAIKHGRNSTLEYVEGVEAFFRKSRPKEIDICGISMYSYFEPNSLYDLILQLAQEGYTIRIAFANPNSRELELQEKVEHKPGSLKHHIEYLIEVFSKKYREFSRTCNLSENLMIVHSEVLPKSFILRAGSRMIVTQYLHRGPHFSPTYILRDVPDGVFEAYNIYLDDVFANSENILEKAQSNK